MIFFFVDGLGMVTIDQNLSQKCIVYELCPKKNSFPTKLIFEINFFIILILKRALTRRQLSSLVQIFRAISVLQYRENHAFLSLPPKKTLNQPSHRWAKPYKKKPTSLLNDRGTEHKRFSNDKKRSLLFR